MAIVNTAPNVTDAEHQKRWLETYNAALTGLLAHGQALQGVVANAQSVADQTHGPINHYPKQ